MLPSNCGEWKGYYYGLQKRVRGDAVGGVKLADVQKKLGTALRQPSGFSGVLNTYSATSVRSASTTYLTRIGVRWGVRPDLNSSTTLNSAVEMGGTVGISGLHYNPIQSRLGDSPLFGSTYRAAGNRVSNKYPFARIFNG